MISLPRNFFEKLGLLLVCLSLSGFATGKDTIPTYIIEQAEGDYPGFVEVIRAYPDSDGELSLEQVREVPESEFVPWSAGLGGGALTIWFQFRIKNGTERTISKVVNLNLNIIEGNVYAFLDGKLVKTSTIGLSVAPEEKDVYTLLNAAELLLAPGEEQTL